MNKKKILKAYKKEEDKIIKNNIDIYYTKYHNGYYIGSIENPYLVLVKAINKEIDSLYIHSSCEFINEEALSNCKNIKDIVIPNNVIYVGNYTFKNCKNLKKIEVLNNNTKFGYRPFKGCKKLNNNIIINSTKFDSDNIYGLAPLKYLARIANIYDNGCYLGTTCNPYLVLVGPINNKIKSIDIHNCCKILSNLAFCKDLEEVEFNDSLLLIDYGAFAYCNSINKLNLPESLVKIDSYAFSDNNNLEYINIPINIRIIRDYTFNCCDKLSNILIESDNYLVEEKAFNSCNKIEFITKS